MKEINAAHLQSLEQLRDVPLEQLEWFVDNSTVRTFGPGEYLFREGDPITGTHIIISGQFSLYIGSNSREIDTFDPDEITGYLPFSRGKVAGGHAVAKEESRVLTFPRERMGEVIRNYFELTQALVHVMTTRVREYTAFKQQNEKMMALGKLSAGLAHELNNPAAAIVRGSSSLRDHLQLLPESFKKIMAIQMTGEQVDVVTERMFEALCRIDKPHLSLMERTEKEDELVDWLDERDVPNAYELAENFVEFGFSVKDLERIEQNASGASLAPVLGWINTNLVTEKMVQDIQEASQRISELVNSVKNFTHMDRDAQMQYADIHTGLQNTLTMLNHKLKKGNITITERFDRSLPEVKAMVGELNQVWTNLIDNAIDALEGVPEAQLEIVTERDKEFVKVSIVDNGPGIPEENLSRIFDPFFTTKEMGKGTGLGLDVVLRIVKQHNGSVRCHSHAGRTEFIVCFPIGEKS